MYNLKEVTEINRSWVFFRFSDGSQDRKAIDLKEVKMLYSDLQNELTFLNRMNNEIQNECDLKRVEMDKSIEAITRIENEIDNRQNEPMIKRGMASICYTLESKKELHKEKRHELMALVELSNKTLAKIDKYEGLKRQCESFIV